MKTDRKDARLFILICITTFASLATVSAIHEMVKATDSGYGEQCYPTQPCDLTADLTCDPIERICTCALPDSMIFDEEAGKCLSLTGLDLENTCFLAPIGGKRRECVKNAECVVRPSDGPGIPTLIGYCKCASGFADYEDRTCGDFITTQGYGEKCNASHFCSSSAILKCSDTILGECQCILEDTMEYSDDEEACLSLSDPESLCYLAPIGGIQFRCIEDARCIVNPADPSGTTGSCSCAPGAEELDDGSCFRDSSWYGEYCNASLACEHSLDLACSPEELCTCTSTDFMVFDPEGNRCVSLTGLDGNCFFEEIDGLQRTCVKDAECAVRPGEDESSNGYCKCASGFADYEDKTCGDFIKSQTYGERCNASHYCSSSSILECSDSEQVDGTCECIYEDTMVYDGDFGACRSLADPDSTCHLEPIGGIQMQCIEKADCILNPEDISNSTGYCQCMNELVAYEDRTCNFVQVQGYDASCNSSHICDPQAILECNIIKKCSCRMGASMIYDEKDKACLSLAGPDSICNVKPIDGIQIHCSENSGCLPHAGSDSAVGSCACLPGYAIYEDMSCGLPRMDRKYAQSCNSTWACTPDDLLSCDMTYENCTCKYNEDFYSETMERCLSPLGGLCFTDFVDGELRNCTETGTCTGLTDSNEGIPYGKCSCSEGYAPEEGNKICVKASFAEALYASMLSLVVFQYLLYYFF